MEREVEKGASYTDPGQGQNGNIKQCTNPAGTQYPGYKSVLAMIFGTCQILCGITVCALSGVMMSWDWNDYGGYIRANSVGISAGIFTFMSGVFAIQGGRYKTQGLIVTALMWGMSSMVMCALMIEPSIRYNRDNQNIVSDSRLGVAAAHASFSIFAFLSSLGTTIISAGVVAWGCCRE